MTKVKKTIKWHKSVKKYGELKDCKVNLNRLSNSTMNRLLNSEHIVHQMDAKIHGDTMRLGKSIIKSSKSMSFNIELKVCSNGVTIIPKKRCEELTSPEISVRFLRPRDNVSKSIVCNSTSTQKPVSTIVKFQTKSINKLIDDAWLSCKKEHKQIIVPNNIVMAKVRGFQPWPAIVLENTNKRAIKVEFFGADENEKFGFVSLNEITLFENSANVIRLVLKKNVQKYRKAVQEAEIICGIPSHASICVE